MHFEVAGMEQAKEEETGCWEEHIVKLEYSKIKRDSIAPSYDPRPIGL